MSGHFNAERAARAVEAAAQQGRLEEMYHAMFETQPQWGEKRTPADDVFRSMAAGLGLDMAAYDAAYADPRTVERVSIDKRDGGTWVCWARRRSSSTAMRFRCGTATT